MHSSVTLFNDRQLSETEVGISRADGLLFPFLAFLSHSLTDTSVTESERSINLSLTKFSNLNVVVCRHHDPQLANGSCQI